MVQFLRILLHSIYKMVTKILYREIDRFQINFSQFLHPLLIP